MQNVILKAHYDGVHIVLDEPFQLPVNAALAVMVIGTADADVERSEWTALAVQSIASAYGDDEPEYALSDLKPQP